LLQRLEWLLAGYGYDITGGDVQDALTFTMEAAANTDNSKEFLAHINEMVSGSKSADQFVSKIISQRLEQAEI